MIWQVVDNYKEFLSLQCDRGLWDIVRIYLYNVVSNVDTVGNDIAVEGKLCETVQCGCIVARGRFLVGKWTDQVSFDRICEPAAVMQGAMKFI